MSRLQGIRANARPDWYKIQTKTEDAGAAQVLIYGEIGDSWWGDSVPAAQFVRDLAAIDADEIHFHINSPGGSVWDGVAIANAIRTSDAKTVAYVDGLAASAASFIAISADETVMALGSQMMIHDPWDIAIGNAAEMSRVSDLLNKVADDLAGMYARKGGGKVEDWRAVMVAETWYTADEAVAAGLADRVNPAAEPEKTAKAMASFDLSMFAYAGRRNAPPPAIPGPARAQTSTSAAGGGTNNPEGADIMPSEKLIQGLRQRLGVAADATLDDDGILAAVDEALAEQPAAAIVSALPEGTVAIDEATLAGLRADAAQGREARAQQVAEHRNAIVSAAINDGRIPPARRDHWLAALAADQEGAEQTLASLAKGLVPLDARGYTGGVTESSDDDRVYEAAFGKGA